MWFNCPLQNVWWNINFLERIINFLEWKCTFHSYQIQHNCWFLRIVVIYNVKLRNTRVLARCQESHTETHAYNTINFSQKGLGIGAIWGLRVCFFNIQVYNLHDWIFFCHNTCNTTFHILYSLRCMCHCSPCVQNIPWPNIYCHS